MSAITIAEVTEIAEKVLELSREYKIKKKTEFFYDALMFPLLSDRHENVHRQLKLKVRVGQRRPTRIDFRIGGAHPAVIELAHGTRQAGLGPSSNFSELQKLCRQRNATMRYLVLLDTSTRLEPLKRPNLKAQYDGWNAGPGQFERHSVRVIYAREGHSFNFKWKAKR